MLYLLLAAALLLVALLAGGETAVVTANRLRTEVRAQRAGWAGRVAKGLVAEPAPLLSAVTVGTTLALVAAALLLGAALGPPLARLWTGALGDARAAGGAVGASRLVAVAAVLVVAQLLPKTLLREPPARVVLALAAPLHLLRLALLPATALVARAARAVARTPARPEALRRDFDLAMGASGGASDFDEEEKEMLENVLEMRTLKVHDSMVARTDVRAVEEGCDLETVRRVFVESGHSRLPVFRESLDRIVGVVLAHDLFHDPASLAAVTRPVRFVPESRPSRDLLFELLGSGTTIAVVLDEFGGTAGIVTVEDLLEELFGDIRDEHDPAAALLRQLDARTFLAAGRARLDELEEAFGIALPEGGYDTVGGYLLDRVGTIPEARQTFDFDGLRFTVLDATASRIGTVRIETRGE